MQEHYTDLCQDCDGHCCKHFSITVRPGDKMLDLVRVHFGRDDVERIKLHVYHRCEQLDAEGKCSIWDSPDRPQFCREFICVEARTNLLEINAEVFEQPLKTKLDTL